MFHELIPFSVDSNAVNPPAVEVDLASSCFEFIYHLPYGNFTSPIHDPFIDDLTWFTCWKWWPFHSSSCFPSRSPLPPLPRNGPRTWQICCNKAASHLGRLKEKHPETDCLSLSISNLCIISFLNYHLRDFRSATASFLRALSAPDAGSCCERHFSSTWLRSLAGREIPSKNIGKSFLNEGLNGKINYKILWMEVYRWENHRNDGRFFPHDESNDGWCFSKSSNSTKIPTSIKFPKFEGWRTLHFQLTDLRDNLTTKIRGLDRESWQWLPFEARKSGLFHKKSRQLGAPFFCNRWIGAGSPWTTGPVRQLVNWSASCEVSSTIAWSPAAKLCQSPKRPYNENECSKHGNIMKYHHNNDNTQ